MWLTIYPTIQPQHGSCELTSIFKGSLLSSITKLIGGRRGGYTITSYFCRYLWT